MRARSSSFTMTLILAAYPASLALAQASTSGAVVSGYPGVVPGTENGPAVAAAPASTVATITWPGFQALPNGSSRVFVQSTAPMGSEVVHKGKTLRIVLGAARLSHRNNGRSLDTRFFDTPVARSHVQVRKGIATLFIELKRDVEPVVSTAPGADGYYFLYVDFPPDKPAVARVDVPSTSKPIATVPAPAPAPSAGQEVRVAGDAEIHGDISTGSGSAGARAGGSLKLGL